MVYSKRRNIINYSQFINNHINKAMDYDGSSGVQCVDLIKYYLDEVFNIRNNIYWWCVFYEKNNNYNVIGFNDFFINCLFSFAGGRGKP